MGGAEHKNSAAREDEQYERKSAIKFLYECIYEIIPEHLWAENKLIACILTRLGIPAGSFGAVKTVLKAYNQLKGWANPDVQQNHLEDHRRRLRLPGLSPVRA